MIGYLTCGPATDPCDTPIIPVGCSSTAKQLMYAAAPCMYVFMAFVYGKSNYTEFRVHVVLRIRKAQSSGVSAKGRVVVSLRGSLEFDGHGSLK